MTTNIDASGMWGGQGRGEGRLSLLDLVRNKTLDISTAALLWLLVERKSSIISAAAPQRAGKTTFLTALLDFAPPRYDRVMTRGRSEDFSFLHKTDPTSTYILVPELSDHTPAYLWGDRVRTLFDALGRGYSMAATIHADAPEEVLSMLAGYPVYISRELLHHAQVIVNLWMLYSPRDIERRVSLVTLVTPGPVLFPLVEWEPGDDEFNQADSPEARAALLKLAGMSEAQLDYDLLRRKETLEGWMGKGPLSADEVRGLVVDYYR